jgi:hypothetical protein
LGKKQGKTMRVGWSEVLPRPQLVRQAHHKEETDKKDSRHKTQDSRLKTNGEINRKKCRTPDKRFLGPSTEILTKLELRASRLTAATAAMLDGIVT